MSSSQLETLRAAAVERANSIADERVLALLQSCADRVERRVAVWMEQRGPFALDVVAERSEEAGLIFLALADKPLKELIEVADKFAAAHIDGLEREFAEDLHAHDQAQAARAADLDVMGGQVGELLAQSRALLPEAQALSEQVEQRSAEHAQRIQEALAQAVGLAGAVIAKTVDEGFAGVDRNLVLLRRQIAWAGTSPAARASNRPPAA